MPTPDPPPSLNHLYKRGSLNRARTVVDGMWAAPAGAALGFAKRVEANLGRLKKTERDPSIGINV